MSQYLQSFKEKSNYRWWRPLLAIALSLVFTVIFMMVVTFAVGLVDGLAHPVAETYTIDASMDASLEEILGQAGVTGSAGAPTTASGEPAYAGMDATNPASMATALLSIAVAIPAIALAMRLSKLGTLADLSSDRGGLDWKSLAVYFGIALCCTVASVLVLGLAFYGPSLFEGFAVHPAALLVILVGAPLQSAAEEYFFRGLVMRSLGSWIPSVVAVVGIQAVLFAILHSYNLAGNVTVMVMGVLFGVLVYSTAGLEASIAYHAANNLVSMVGASLLPALAVSANTGVLESALNIVASTLISVLLYFTAKKMGKLVSTKA